MIDEKATFEEFGYYPSDLTPHSGKKIVAVCDDCGKVRVLNKHIYSALCGSCSQKGERHPQFGKKGKNHPNWKGGGVKRICEICGTEFPISPSLIKKGYGRFCSRKCAGECHSKNIRGENNHSWKGGKIMRICEICGTKFSLHPSLTKNDEGRFCSPKCQSKWYSKQVRGENNPNWKNGVSFEPYCHKFNNEFKEYIRDKFGRTCFLCDKTEEENGKRLSIHHVNGNKNCGCDEDETCQFVPLCNNCHAKVHSKKVDWGAKIKAKMQNKLNGWYI